MQIETVFCFQGGVNEEQMLKFMGANTQLYQLEVKKLLEVFTVSYIAVLLSIIVIIPFLKYLRCSI